MDKKLVDLPKYGTKEETLNILTHAIGYFVFFILSIILVYKAASKSIVLTVSSAIYGLTLVILYSSSTIYHMTKDTILE